MITRKEIDNGKSFDWGKTSLDYGKFRDIYPESFYQNLLQMGIGLKGQRILDLGTGTGVLPRGLYKYGAHFIGTDISEDQIGMAKEISAKAGMDIPFYARPAEDTKLPTGVFDVITACQCFIYFDKSKVFPEIKRMLKKDGKFATMWMAWLPNEDRLSKLSEELVLKYNPHWKGSGYERMSVNPLEWLNYGLEVEKVVSYDEMIPFNHDSWAGRIRACRGIGASLSDEKVGEFDKEHMNLLKETVKYNFSVLHHILLVTYKTVDN